MTRTRLAVWAAAIVLVALAAVGYFDMLTVPDPGHLNITMRWLGSAATYVILASGIGYFIYRPGHTDHR